MPYVVMKVTAIGNERVDRHELRSFGTPQEAWDYVEHQLGGGRAEWELNASGQGSRTFYEVLSGVLAIPLRFTVVAHYYERAPWDPVKEELATFNTFEEADKYVLDKFGSWRGFHHKGRVSIEHRLDSGSMTSYGLGPTPTVPYRIKKRFREEPFLYATIAASLIPLILAGYTLSQLPISLGLISTIGSLLITVEGVLLGLLGISFFAQAIKRVRRQVVLTVAALLMSLALVLFSAQSNDQGTIAWPALRGFMVFDIAVFASVVVVYSDAIIQTKKEQLIVEDLALEGSPTLHGPTTGQITIRNRGREPVEIARYSIDSADMAVIDYLFGNSQILPGQTRNLTVSLPSLRPFEKGKTYKITIWTQRERSFTFELKFSS